MTGQATPESLDELASDENAPDELARHELSVLRERLKQGTAAGDDPEVDARHVTIAVPTRDGLAHVQRLVDGLVHTDHPNFDLVMVDNASSDGTRQWLADQDLPFPVQVVANDRNETFSTANNQALEVARGELFLALNNDVVPLQRDWLTRLVAVLAPDTAGVGALLLHPPTTGPLQVQHAGVAFHVVHDRVRARNIGAGTAPDRWVAGGVQPVPALTAACLLMRTADLRDIGGMDEAYVYGTEDWELCLHLAARGRLALVGDSVLVHQESSTQLREDPEQRRARHRANHTVFNRRWGPALRRRVLLERLAGIVDGRRMGPTGPQRVHVAAPASVERTELEDDFAAAGWMLCARSARAMDLAVIDQRAIPDTRPDAAVIVVVAHADGMVDLPTWVDMVVHPAGLLVEHRSTAVTVPLASGRPTAAAIIHGVVGQLRRPRVAVRASPPNWDKAPVWGDTHFATSFAAALRNHGCAARVQVVSDWAEPEANAFDVVVHLRGLAAQDPNPGATNVMWLISHPELVTDDELDGYDHVLVASADFAETLRQRTATPVGVMWQAVDVDRFRPAVRDRSRDAHGIVAVAAPRWPSRPSVQWLSELGWDASVYGPYWSRRTHNVEALEGFVPNDELVHVYGNADVVVADQWTYMADHGFVANRLFDVLAAGGFCISDAGSGVDQLFGDLVPTYRTRNELDAQLHRWMTDPAGRNAVSARAMRMVRRDHSFDARARQLLDLLGID